MNTGWPAFPVQSIYVEDQETNSHGMTLRDYFAAKAMQAIVSNSAEINPAFDAVAEDAYMQADAMLRVREQ